MDKITVEQLHELYVDTLSKCGSYLLNEDDETIEYNIFEEFDIGLISFLHDDSLIRLFEAELISSEEMKEAQKLRKLAIDVQNKNEWNLLSFRTSVNWKEVLKLADKLNILINKGNRQVNL